ncbi:MAG: ComF family protein [Candidatus Levyibacteriota bacterium]
MGFLDFIFPKYCVNCRKIGAYICPDCFTYLSFDVGEICLACNRPSINGLTHPYCRGRYVIDGAFSSICYKGIAKKLIYSFKYKPYLSDLKKVLTDLFYEGLIQKEAFNKILEESDEFILVPIPLHASKLKSRGYNQAEILASELAQRFNFNTQNLLERTKNTRSQVGLKEKERRENISGAFRIVNHKLSAISNKQVFLVDDVLTTGSTLAEAAKVLKKAGAKKVFGLTLAKD